MINYYNRKEVSNSDLSWLKDQLSGVQKSDPTEAYNFGSLIDCMITEHDKVNYFNFTCDGVQFKPEQFEQAKEMKKAFFRDEICARMIKHSETQKVMIEKKRFVYGSLEFELDVRCKWDLWMQQLGWGGDIKSTTATTQKQFEAAVRYFDYDRQRAWYMNIAGSKQDILIGISKKNFKVFKVPIEFGDELHKSGVEKYEYLTFQWFKHFGNIDSATIIKELCSTISAA